MDKEMIAYCGLDCYKCEAYLATINNDDSLREIVAEKWSKLNGITITKEMINCLGCIGKGLKTPYCEALCNIKNCCISKSYEHCGKCANLDTCKTIGEFFKYNDEPKKKLESLK